MGSIKDLGAWAEDRFSGLCAAAGVTRNKSVQDRTGWDYLVEFPSKLVPGLPADLQPPEQSARIQIKSKISGKPSVALKLSNAVRFAKEPSPCFIVLMVLGEDGETVRVYARHIWKDEIIAALRRARQAGEAESADLHRRSLTFSFSEADDHTHDLLVWMRTVIEAVGERYVEIKAELARSVGQEDGGIHGSITFAAEDLEALIDNQLGLTESAPLARVTVKQRRFGIDAPQPLFSAKPDFARMSSKPLDCRIKIWGESFEDLWLDGELYLPAFPDLKPALQKMRIVTGLLEIIHRGVGDPTATFKGGRDVAMSLKNLRAMFDLRRIIAAGPFDVKVFHKGVCILAFDGFLEMPDKQWIGPFSDVLSSLERAAGGVAPEELTVSIADLDEAFSDLSDFYGLVSGGGCEGTFTLDSPMALGTPKHFVAFDYVDIGAWTFLAIVARPIQTFSATEGGFRFNSGQPRVLEGRVMPRPSSPPLSELFAMRQRASEQLPDTLAICGGSYRHMLAFMNGDVTAAGLNQPPPSPPPPHPL